MRIRRDGYVRGAGGDRGFAAGVICAGGTLGILIPPSIMLIVYAAIAELSPLRLYAAAIFPGFILAGFYMIYVVGYAFLKPSIAPKPIEEEVPPNRTIIIQLLTSVCHFPHSGHIYNTISVGSYLPYFIRWILSTRKLLWTARLV